ncbi:hypothetical protein DMENIID0001_132730 [Sergentomyia squamirostris]
MNRMTLRFGVLVTMLLLAEAYPIFGTKRYHRASNIPLQLSPVPIYTAAIPQYYDYSPYDAQYQSYGLPIYHGEYKPTPYYYAQGPSYGYYDDRGEDAPNPMDHLHEEMLQEDQRERFHENSLPIGQETWYAEPSAKQDSLANANAAFLRNLIAYNRQINAAAEQPDDSEFEEYGEFADNPAGYYETPQDTYYNPYEPPQKLNGNLREDDDDDVRELKHLAYERDHQHHHQTPQQDVAVQEPWFRGNDASIHQYEAEPEYDDDEWINWDSKRSVLNVKQKGIDSILSITDRKPSNLVPKHKGNEDVTKSPVEGKEIVVKGNGQKEVVLPRPATPVHQPFAPSAMKFIHQQQEAAVVTQEPKDSPKDAQKRTPGKGKQSVYDTIQHLMAMEHRLEEKEQQQLNRLKKRFAPNDPSLVKQLKGLKKTTT